MTRPLVLSQGVTTQAAQDFAPTNDVAPCLLVFGSISTPTGTTYLYPGFGIDAANAEIKLAIPSSLTLRKVSVRARVGPQGGSQTYTVRKNGSNLTGFAATLAAGQTGGGAIPETAATFAYGDDLSVSVVSGAGMTVGAQDVAVLLELTRA